MNRSYRGKDTLARLLARENIFIKHSNRQSISFDPKNRVLTLPVLQAITDENIHDLIIGTGSASVLYGQRNAAILQNALTSISSDKNQAKMVLNIIESIRTEKLIRRRYKGLSRIFTDAYAEILGDYSDIFKNQEEMLKLNIVERLNLSFKMGLHVKIPFKKEELPLVDLVSRINSFDDSVNAARELLKFMEDPPSSSSGSGGQEEENEEESDSDKDNSGSNNSKNSDQNKNQNKDQNKNQNKDQNKDQDQDQDQNGDSGDNDNSDENKSNSDKSKEKSDDENSNKNNQKKDSDQNKNQDKDQKENSDSKQDQNKNQDQDQDQNGDSDKDSDFSKKQDKSKGKDKENKPASGKLKLTKNDFKFSEKIMQSMQDCIDPNKLAEPEIVYMPESLDPNEYIVDYKIFFEICESAWKNQINNIRDEALTWMKENDLTISYMVQEFERKKRAALYARRKVAKTGIIDTNKLVHSMYSEDIFKRNINVPEGKNHAMSLFLDWSSSMGSITSGTIDQLLNLVLFCRRAGIPHEAYLFTDKSSTNLVTRKKITVGKFNEIRPTNELKLIQIFSDTMTKADFIKAVTYLYQLKMHFSKQSSMPYPYALMQSSTPLDSTMLVASFINDRLRERTDAEIVKTCVITDGMSNAGINVNGRNIDSAEVIQDKKTGRYINVDSSSTMTSKMTELSAHRSNSQFYGFYLTTNLGDGIRSILLQRLNLSFELPVSMIEAEFAKNNFVVATNFGFEDYYIINPININRESITDKTNVSSVLKNRLQHRVLLNRFIEKIADTN